MLKKNILIVIGTRPEAIKMAPLIQALKDEETINLNVCVTAQHREMLDQVLHFFEITPNYDLDLMKPAQNLFSLTSTIIESLKPILEEFQPDYLFVHGDTTTTMASAIAGFYFGAKVCHVEAGLRTNNKLSPFPEEINRQIAARICHYHFAPTIEAKKNLLKENIEESTILVTGNTVIDALLNSVDKVKQNPSDKVIKLDAEIGEHKEIILVTGHRRENHGGGFERICRALKIIAEKKPEVTIVFPVHLNPKVKNTVYKYLANTRNIKLIEPLPYPDFIWLMNRSKLIITDSGGVQEEAPTLGKPVIVLRDNTERPEAVKAGTVLLVGTNQEQIVSEVLDLLNNSERYVAMSLLHNPYGDGKACNRILNFIKEKP